MQITSLKKIVEENNIKFVTYELEGGTISFGVPSTHYDEKKDWLVKGSRTIWKDIKSGEMWLHCARLEKELNISVNKPTIVQRSELSKEDDSKLDEMINTKLSVVVFHRGTLEFSAKEVKRQHVRAFANACIEAYTKAHSDAKPEDFAIIEIVWSDRNVALKSL